MRAGRGSKAASGRTRRASASGPSARTPGRQPSKNGAPARPVRCARCSLRG
jgi:hypothetical protein